MLSGTLAIQDGDFDAAGTWFNKVVELRPNSTDAMYRLSVINRLPMTAEPVLLKELGNTEAGSTSHRYYAGLALYRLLSRNGQPENAFKALAAAKAIRAQEYPYNTAPASASMPATGGSLHRPSSTNEAMKVTRVKAASLSSA